MERCQYHAKQARAFLLRLVHVMPPLELPEIRQTELEDQQRIKAEATSPACQTMVPRPRTHFEVFLGLGEESIPLSVLQRVYRLSPATLKWIWEYVESTAICHLLLASARSSALRLETFQSPAFHLITCVLCFTFVQFWDSLQFGRPLSKQAKNIFFAVPHGINKYSIPQSPIVVIMAPKGGPYIAPALNPQPQACCQQRRSTDWRQRFEN